MASSKFVNDFLLGADPELVLLNPPNIHNVGNGHLRDDETGYFGFDHGGYVLEPHPAPHVSARQVCNGIRDSLDYMYFRYPNFKFRAGAFVRSPQRHVALGGHVHLDMPDLNLQQIQAMDVFAQSLVGLEILPPEECRERRDNGYGAGGDVRRERGRVEYRSLCSWLFSRKTSMLAITGIKLCAVAPKTLPKIPMDSVSQLVGWLEGFKSSDDDARWILEKDYFGSSMVANPDATVTGIWKSDADRGSALRDKFIADKIGNKKAMLATQAALLGAAANAMQGQVLHGQRNRDGLRLRPAVRNINNEF